MSILSNVSNQNLSKLAAWGGNRGTAAGLVQREAQQELGERIRDSGNFTKLSDHQLLLQWWVALGRGGTDVVSQTTAKELAMEIAGRAVRNSAPLSALAFTTAGLFVPSASPVALAAYSLGALVQG